MAEVKPAELLTSDPSVTTASNSKHDRSSIDTTEIKFKESNKKRTKKVKEKLEHRHSNSANKTLYTENKCTKLNSEQTAAIGSSSTEEVDGGGHAVKYKHKHDAHKSKDNDIMKSTLENPNGTDMNCNSNEDGSRIGLKKTHKSKKKKKHKEDTDIEIYG